MEALENRRTVLAQTDTSKPNILIFLIDQMPYDMVDPDHPCKMPNAERLAREGVSFTRTFTSSPHCCPSRANFMTGLYRSRHGVYNNVDTNTASQFGLNPGVRTFSDYLADAGYQLAYAGKWHVSNEETPGDRGWKELVPYEKKQFSRRNEDWDEMTERNDVAEHPRESGEIVRQVGVPFT